MGKTSCVGEVRYRSKDFYISKNSIVSCNLDKTSIFNTKDQCSEIGGHVQYARN